MLVRIFWMALFAIVAVACSPNALILESSVMGPMGTNNLVTGPVGPNLIRVGDPPPPPENSGNPYIMLGRQNYSQIGLPNGDYAVPPPIELNNSALLSWAGNPGIVDQEQRNLYQTELMRRSDQLCTYYLSRLYLIRGGANVASQTGIGVIDVVGTLFTSTYALNVFGKLNAGLTDSRKLLSDEFLAHEMMSRAVSQITSDRDNLRAIMLSNQSRTFADYPVSRAIYDVTEYHNRCNVFQAASRLGNNQTPLETRPETTSNTLFQKDKAGGEKKNGGAAKSSEKKNGNGDKKNAELPKQDTNVNQ